MSSIHEYALELAERFNPGGKHAVTSVEFDGQPDPDDPDAPYIDVRVNVFTRLPYDAQLVDIKLNVIPIEKDEDERS